MAKTMRLPSKRSPIRRRIVGNRPSAVQRAVEAQNDRPEPIVAYLLELEAELVESTGKANDNKTDADLFREAMNVQLQEQFENILQAKAHDAKIRGLEEENRRLQEENRRQATELGDLKSGVSPHASSNILGFVVPAESQVAPFGCVAATPDPEQHERSADSAARVEAVQELQDQICSDDAADTGMQPATTAISARTTPATATGQQQAGRKPRQKKVSPAMAKKVKKVVAKRATTAAKKGANPENNRQNTWKTKGKDQGEKDAKSVLGLNTDAQVMRGKAPDPCED